MYTITFKRDKQLDVKVQAELGENILEIATNAGLAIDAPCAGNGVCGKCRVRLISGLVDAERTSGITKEDMDDGWILSCQAKVAADATLWIPDTASAFVSDIRTADLGSEKEINLYNSLIEKVFDAGISTGTSYTGFGIAIDIGTTTVTGACLDLNTGKVLSKASLGNGQIKYGADVINRIIRQTKPGGVEKLRSAIREETLIPLIDTLCQGADTCPADISKFVIAGNTTMEHLFLGEDGDSIRLEPYVPAFLERSGDTADSTGLVPGSDAPVVFAPNVGSYVGGDITAGALMSLLWNNEGMSLFIDLGTNGEIVMGNSDYMLTCACSAGPAFEGGDISCGMRATTGAVQATVLSDDFEPTYDIIGGGDKVAGLCGSGLIDTIAELFRTNAIDARGKFIGHGKRIRYDEYGLGSYVVAFAEDSVTGADITLTESDLDNFIRAKGAVFSAILTMLNSVDLTVDDLDSIILAGGIGSGINIEKSISIGMLPKAPLEKYSYIGNSSLTGACAMLLSDEANDKVFELGSCMTYIELSTHPGYMDEFVAACFIPHTNASLFD